METRFLNCVVKLFPNQGRLIKDQNKQQGKQFGQISVGAISMRGLHICPTCIMLIFLEDHHYRDCLTLVSLQREVFQFATLPQISQHDREDRKGKNIK